MTNAVVVYDNNDLELGDFFCSCVDSLDELFEKKDEIALEVQKQVAEEMSTYGYIIVKTLITKVEPDAEVKQSMNEINAAQRKRVAAQELAEADKIKIVTAAEAEAEKPPHVES